jgi:hypothetical protein
LQNKTLGRRRAFEWLLEEDCQFGGDSWSEKPHKRSKTLNKIPSIETNILEEKPATMVPRSKIRYSLFSCITTISSAKKKQDEKSETHLKETPST